MGSTVQIQIWVQICTDMGSTTDKFSLLSSPNWPISESFTLRYLTPQKLKWHPYTCISPNWWQREYISKMSLMTNFTARHSLYKLHLFAFCTLRNPICLLILFLKGWVGWEGKDGLHYKTHWRVLVESQSIFGQVLFMIACFYFFYCSLNLCYDRHTSKCENKQVINLHLQNTTNAYAFRALHLCQALHVKCQLYFIQVASKNVVHGEKEGGAELWRKLFLLIIPP